MLFRANRLVPLPFARVVLISLARVMLFRGRKGKGSFLGMEVLISLARVMLFRVANFVRKEAKDSKS